MSSESVTSKAESATSPRSKTIFSLGADWHQYVVYAAFVLIFVFFAVTLRDQGFLSTDNLLNIVRQTAIIAIMAMAMTFVLSAGEIDLSIGSIAGLVSVVTALVLNDHAWPLAVAAGLATGLLVGVVNGSLTAWVGVPSFLATLGMMGMARGAGMWVSHTAAVPIVDKKFSYIFGSGNIGPLPVLVFWMAAMAVVAHVALRNTPFGQKVLATGGGETAARYSGVNTRLIKFQVLLLTALAASLAGMLYAGRLRSGRFQLGEGDELSVIAAAVLGGTSLFGGSGTVIGSIVGALLIGIINNGLILMGLEYSQQLMVRGLLIVLAVAVRGAR
jgi:ribose transport system permease protein